MPNLKTRIDGIKASVRNLTQERRMQYISLKQLAPKEEQEFVREAFLFFQDEAMMDMLVDKYAK